MTRTLVFSGGGDYADPWHGYAESSEHVAELLRALGDDLELTASVATALGALEDRPDLLVVNAGAGAAPHPDDASLAGAAIAHVAGGGTLLVLHLSTGLFPGNDAWEQLIGARWIWDSSGHPPNGPFTVAVEPDPLVAGIDDFDIVDEAYARLRLSGDSRVLASHTHDPEGGRHPLVWLREPRAASEERGGRVAVDLLGHDAASFASGGHVALLERVHTWLTPSRGAPR